MKKILILFIIFIILTLSISLTQSGDPSQTARVNAQPTNLMFLQDTPEHALESFYTNLLIKDKGTMAALFYRSENYAPMVTDTFYAQVDSYQEHPVYRSQPVTSSDYALYTITYTLRFKGIKEPVPFLDVLPLIKQDGKWYIFIEDPTATPLEQAIKKLYVDPVYNQAEQNHKLQLQAILTKYPELVNILN